MKNFRRKGDICILDKSLTAVWGQSQREEKLELGSGCSGSHLCLGNSSGYRKRNGMENCTKGQ